MKKIKLTQGKVALVDDKDFERVNKKRWQAQQKPATYYVIGQTSKLSKGGQKTIYLHREIIGKPPKGMEVDHINGDGLDNRRENLRFVTRRQNMQNKQTIRSSKYPGVSWHQGTQKWQSRIHVGGKQTHLGVFTDEKEAFIAYRKAVESIGERVLGY